MNNIIVALCVLASYGFTYDSMLVYGTKTEWRYILGEYRSIDVAQYHYSKIGEPEHCAVFTDKDANDNTIGYSVRCKVKPRYKILKQFVDE